MPSRLRVKTLLTTIFRRLRNHHHKQESQDYARDKPANMREESDSAALKFWTQRDDPIK
jgi:hypothetical protein